VVNVDGALADILSAEVKNSAAMDCIILGRGDLRCAQTQVHNDVLVFWRKKVRFPDRAYETLSQYHLFAEGRLFAFLKSLEQKVTIVSHRDKGEPYQQVMFAS
jgi:hypothetical protein